ncbi:hypothetical protein CASFOL_013924 [Castilleja foliolosa]|uniref:BED-type domain-containing protein n=1 Tax=Castilleja foliolosa TaxID=1961234 RepID=A0ABD3DMI8_9LAMI
MASKEHKPLKKKKGVMVGKSGLAGNHGKSGTWEYFDKIDDTETKKWIGDCKCKYCKMMIYSPSNIGTNKLWTHIGHCKEIPIELKDKEQTIVNIFGGAMVNWKFDQEKCRRACGVMIIVAELPFCIVEDTSFRAFCAEMQPRFHVVSRPTITKDCYQLFFEEKEKLRNYFTETSTRVAITTDMWTIVPHPHKGDVIAKVIESCLLEWGLEKIMSVTLDNAKNNDTCVSDLKRRLNKRGGMLLLGGEFFHVRCFAHIMNLVVRDGIEMVTDTIKRLRRSVKYVRSSPSRMQMFRKCVEEEKITSKRLVCMDVKTRWNSTYHMIDSALPFEKAFDRLEEQDPSYSRECESLNLDWVKLKRLHSFLEEFYMLTKRISGSYYTSSHTFFDEITNVKVLLTRELGNEDFDRFAMATRMHEKFEKYCDLDKLNPIFLVSVILDPRNKIEYLELWYDKLLEFDPTLNDETRIKKVEEFMLNVKSFMNRLYDRYKVEAATIVQVEGNLASEVTNKDSGKGKNVRDEIRAKLKRKNSVDSSNDLERYLNDGIEEGGPDFDILLWWKGKVATYRSVAIMARDILSIPITSVASESAFSGAGRVLDPFRSSLTPKLVEALVCAQDWLRGGANIGVDIEIEEDIETLVQLEKSIHEFQSLAIDE